jgi:hypothetical protein
MITEIRKILLPNSPTTNFNQRERQLNVAIQKLIDEYQRNGFKVVNRDITYKTSSHANVKFDLQQLPRIS